MVNYHNSIIYKICCKDVNIKKIYVGSTANALRVRKSKHKSSCNNENNKNYNLYVYQFIRQNGGFDNWSMIEIEKYKCENKQELHKRERFYIEELNAELNKVIPNRSLEEWYKDNKETILEKNKEYRIDNKEKIAEINKQYYENNKETITEYKKEYYEKNKETILEKVKKYQKKYRNDNKETITQKQKQKFKCGCGGKYTLQNKAGHLKTKRHQTYLQNLNNNN
jgi:hypothetical protein